MDSLNLKDECLRNLACTKNSYYVTIFGVSSFSYTITNDWEKPNILLPHNFYGSVNSFPLLDFVAKIKTIGPEFGISWQKNLELAVRDSAMSAVRNYYKETYEYVAEYCNATGQFDKFQGEPWYRFARLLRNSVTHDRKIRFTKADLKRFKEIGPITYKHLSIDETTDGLSMSDVSITTEMFIDLCEEICLFAKNGLD